MSSDHFRQNLPNRRFRRLLPAAVAAVTLATSAPFALPHTSRAATHPPKAHIAPPRDRIPASPPAARKREPQPQATSAG
jgi:hypothetical protein